MSNRRDYFFRQLVSESELDDGFTGLEDADRALAVDVGVAAVDFDSDNGGIHAGLDAVATGGLNVSVSAGAAADNVGRRVAIPAGPAIVVDLSKTGTTNVGVGGTPIGGVPTAPGVGLKRWVTLFIFFDRALSDERTDGTGADVFFQRDESFRFAVSQGTPAASPTNKAPLQSGKLLLSDYVVNDAGAIETTDTSRRQVWIRAVDSGQPTTRVGTGFAVRGLEEDNGIREAIKQLLGYYNDHVNPLENADPHPAGGATYAAGETWFDGTQLGAGVPSNVQDALDAVQTDLKSTAGTAKIGSAAVAGSVDSLTANSALSQLTQLLGFINDRLELSASAGVQTVADGVVFNASSTDTIGVDATSTGAAAAIRGTGDVSGPGVLGLGGSAGAPGLRGFGGVTGGAGVEGTGGAVSGTGIGGTFTGGAGGGAGAQGTAKMDFPGIKGIGDGALATASSTTRPGIYGVGGTTSSAGVEGLGGSPNGSGMIGRGTGAGAGVVGQGGVTNGVGGAFTGQGSGAGVSGLGGSTGHGLIGTGGVTSGAGVRGVGQAVNATGVEGIGSIGGAGVAGTGGIVSGPGVAGQGTDAGAGGRFFAGATGHGVDAEATNAATYAVRGINTAGTAMYAESTGGGGGGLVGQAHGGGVGVVGLAGSGSGAGVEGIGSLTSIDTPGVIGVGGLGGGVAHGVEGFGVVNGAGGSFTGGATGVGVLGVGGSTSGIGGWFFGSGTFAGCAALGGASSGPGGDFFGGPPDGDGVRGTADGDGDGGVFAAAGTGFAAHIRKTGGTGAGVHIEMTGSTGNGLIITPNGTKSAIRLVGQADPSAGNLTDGDVWYDGTDLKFRRAGLTRTIALV